MPRFYFVIQGLGVTEDLGQIDLPNHAAAHDKAVKAARAYRAALSLQNMDPMHFAVVVSDQSHRVVEVVPSARYEQGGSVKRDPPPDLPARESGSEFPISVYGTPGASVRFAPQLPVSS